MSALPAPVCAATLGTDLPRLHLVVGYPDDDTRRHVTDDSGPGDTPGGLSTADVAERLGIAAYEVRRIPRDLLPYEESTPGGTARGGKRRYRPDDVDTYRRLKAAGLTARPRRARVTNADILARLDGLTDVVADMRREIADLRRRIDDDTP